MRPRVADQSTAAGRQPCPYFTARLCHRTARTPAPRAERSLPLEKSRDFRAVRNVRGSALREYRSVPILVGDAGDIAHHVLDGEVLLERIVAHVLAEAGRTQAAVRHLADDRDVVIDPHAAGLDLTRSALRPVHVACPGR